jgi:hypothetical protein
MQQEFPSAKVICHSRAPNGDELIGLEVELHRFILPEANTHRSLSRNYQSSRAVPVLRQLEQIANDPAMPVYYGKEQSGMIAGDELDGRDLELAKMIILSMRDACLNGVKQLQKLGLHKQVSNRYVEPWMKTKGFITATKTAWKAFFALRIHFAAQPEICLWAERIKEAVDNSAPVDLDYGDYHLPYVQQVKCLDTNNTYYFTGKPFESDEISLSDAIKISCSCIAQVSYRRLDDSLEKAHRVYEMLNLPVDGKYPVDPPHFSPSEGIAKVMCEEEMMDAGLWPTEVGGNFNSRSFWQYRKALEMGIEKQFLEG